MKNILKNIKKDIKKRSPDAHHEEFVNEIKDYWKKEGFKILSPDDPRHLECKKKSDEFTQKELNILPETE